MLEHVQGSKVQECLFSGLVDIRACAAQEIRYTQIYLR